MARRQLARNMLPTRLQAYNVSGAGGFCASSRPFAHFFSTPPPADWVPQLHELRLRLPDEWSARGSRTTYRGRHSAGSPGNVGAMPAAKLAPEVLNGIARLQQFGRTEWLAPGNGECKSDLTEKPAITRIRKRRPLSARPCHVRRVSASTAHF